MEWALDPGAVIGIAVAAFFDHDFEPARRAEPVDRRRLEDVDDALANGVLQPRLQSRSKTTV